MSPVFSTPQDKSEHLWHITYPCQYVSTDGLMFLNSGINLGEVAPIARIRQHLNHLFQVALPKHTLEQMLKPISTIFSKWQSWHSHIVQCISLPFYFTLVLLPERYRTAEPIQYKLEVPTKHNSNRRSVMPSPGCDCQMQVMHITYIHAENFH